MQTQKIPRKINSFTKRFPPKGCSGIRKKHHKILHWKYNSENGVDGLTDFCIVTKECISLSSGFPEIGVSLRHCWIRSCSSSKCFVGHSKSKTFQNNLPLQKNLNQQLMRRSFALSHVFFSHDLPMFFSHVFLIPRLFQQKKMPPTHDTTPTILDAPRSNGSRDSRCRSRALGFKWRRKPHGK